MCVCLLWQALPPASLPVERVIMQQCKYNVRYAFPGNIRGHTHTHTLWNFSLNPRRRAECVLVLFHASWRLHVPPSHRCTFSTCTSRILCKGASLSTCKYLIFDFPSHGVYGVSDRIVSLWISVYVWYVHAPTHWKRVHWRLHGREL